MDKINYIDKILWINLEKSINRRTHIEALLKDVNIPNCRINAIDAEKNSNIKNIINIPFERDLNNYEIACALSHIKAILSLKEEIGDYFMICEDDISFDNIKYFPDNIDLKYIIENSPQFDILMLYKTCCNETDDLYSNWNEYYNKGIHLYGAVSYIISRNGINKMSEICKYIDDNNFIFNNNIKFDFSEFILYKNLETYCYKYNFISIIDTDTTIGSNTTFHKNSNKFQLELIKNKYCI